MQYDIRVDADVYRHLHKEGSINDSWTGLGLRPEERRDGILTFGAARETIVAPGEAYRVGLGLSASEKQDITVVSKNHLIRNGVSAKQRPE
jgi:hypothetical protein